MDAPIRLELLHHFRLTAHGADVALAEGAQRLVAYLAVSARPQARDALAPVLWPDRAESDARATLRRSLWLVNRAAPSLLSRSGSYLAVAADVVVDLRRLEAVVDASTRGGALEPGSDEIALLTADLLPQWSFDWLDGRRELLRQLRLHALETAARAASSAGRPDTALSLALAAIGIDPLRESAHRIVIAVHLSEDNSAAALRHHALYRDLLWRELRLRPGAQMQALMEQLGGPFAAIEPLQPRMRSVRA